MLAAILPHRRSAVSGDAESVGRIGNPSYRLRVAANRFSLTSMLTASGPYRYRPRAIRLQGPQDGH